jgi:hypothetical protein
MNTSEVRLVLLDLREQTKPEFQRRDLKFEQEL